MHVWLPKWTNVRSGLPRYNALISLSKLIQQAFENCVHQYAFCSPVLSQVQTWVLSLSVKVCSQSMHVRCWSNPMWLVTNVLHMWWLQPVVPSVYLIQTSSFHQCWILLKPTLGPLLHVYIYTCILWKKLVFFSVLRPTLQVYHPLCTGQMINWNPQCDMCMCCVLYGC